MGFLNAGFALPLPGRSECGSPIFKLIADTRSSKYSQDFAPTFADDYGNRKSAHTPGGDRRTKLTRLCSPPSYYGAKSEELLVDLIGRALVSCSRDVVEMISPTLECGAHLPFVASAIINTSNASLVTAHMVEDCLD